LFNAGVSKIEVERASGRVKVTVYAAKPGVIIGKGGQEIEKTKAELGDKARCDEDVLSYISFPQVAEKFFKAREEKESNTVNYTIEKKED
jgi:ribosomal protein S3